MNKNGSGTALTAEEKPRMLAANLQLVRQEIQENNSKGYLSDLIPYGKKNRIVDVDNFCGIILPKILRRVDYADACVIVWVCRLKIS
ncbi:MAG: hypothetical protein ACLTJ5_03750 [Clostridium sp.]